MDDCFWLILAKRGKSGLLFTSVKKVVVGNAHRPPRRKGKVPQRQF